MRSKLTTLCYIEKDGCYLMMHRVKKQNDINRDKWIGVGGHFEDCESPEECLLREVKEETGLTLNSWKFRGIVTFVSTDSTGTVFEYMHLFTSDDFSGTMTDCDEGNLEWVQKSQLKNLNFWEGDYVFLDLIDKNEPFFSLKLVYKDGKLTDTVLNGKPLK
ncbi:MAG: 8-oxo-dGTP diphosphatase [Treponema sp.]|nr:8-oxo-dGTP diphosphatase [Treponema sp.]